jgi:hypothetical protein
VGKVGRAGEGQGKRKEGKKEGNGGGGGEWGGGKDGKKGQERGTWEGLRRREDDSCLSFRTLSFCGFSKEDKEASVHKRDLIDIAHDDRGKVDEVQGSRGVPDEGDRCCVQKL